jgi:hypothetical protein
VTLGFPTGVFGFRKKPSTFVATFIAAFVGLLDDKGCDKGLGC